MTHEYVYLNFYYRSNLESIFEQLLKSLSDCHFLFNVKGSNFKHRVSCLEYHLPTLKHSHIDKYNSVNYIELVNTTKHIENVLSTFTCGQHRLEVQLFNSIFYLNHQLIILIQAIDKDMTLE